MNYLKDNRILPDGFDKGTADEDIAVKGAACGTGISPAAPTASRTRWLESAPGPVTVTAELWYQPIGYRWAHNLADTDAAEIDRFVSYYKEQAADSAVMLARDVVVVE